MAYSRRFIRSSNLLLPGGLFPGLASGVFTRQAAVCSCVSSVQSTKHSVGLSHSAIGCHRCFKSAFLFYALFCFRVPQAFPVQQCSATDPLGVHAFCRRQKSRPPTGPLTADVGRRIEDVDYGEVRNTVSVIESFTYQRFHVQRQR